MANAARPILNQLYDKNTALFRPVFQAQIGNEKAMTDMVRAAHAATFGATDTLLVDIDKVVPGTIDETDGTINLSNMPSAGTYGVINEIADRSLNPGATVIGVRKSETPGKALLAATLRQAL